MAQLYTIGWAASEPKHGTSVNQNPYTMFSLGNTSGTGSGPGSSITRSGPGVM